MSEKQTGPGEVFLVGAGPGDPGLITERGVQCLRQADVVVYDYLASAELLDYAPQAAERIYVGKKAGQHTLSQEEINSLLVEKARQGKRVVRLKGGDPFVFGRGGEEALALAEASLRFEVVPGVSAAVAAPAYAGIPVTHRGLTSTLALITGHEDPLKEESDINWEKLATAAGTLCFYMGVGRLPQIAEQLMRYGRSPETPVAVIRWGTCPTQQTVVGTLQTIAEEVRKVALKPPAMIVVGEVVRLREKLNWFEQQPLFGKRVIVTRSRAQASELSHRLRALGAQVRELPVIEIVPPDSWQPLDRCIRQLERYDWIIFTSVNGVRSLLERLEASARDIRDLKGCRLCAIGPATARELEQYRLRVDLVPDRYVAESLLAALAEREDLPGKRFLLPRADIARDVLPEQLRQRGAEVDCVVAYRTVQGYPDTEGLRAQLEAGEIDWITLSSSSTARNFFQLLGLEQDKARLLKVRFASIGPITSQTLRQYGVEPAVESAVHTIPALVEAMVAFEANS